jgi:hypothetical protein
MASKRYSLSGSVLKQLQALAEAADMTEAETVTKLIEIGLGRIDLRISQSIIDSRNAKNERADHA